MRLSVSILLVILLIGCTGVSKKNQVSDLDTTIDPSEIENVIENLTESNQTPSALPVVELQQVQWCNDSDGKNSSTKGVVVANNRNYEDYCLDTVKVKEYYCDGNLANSEINECGFGYNCKYGKCEKTKIICIDSDNGRNIEIQGSVTVDSLGLSGVFIDKCIDSYLAKEYWCENDNMITEDIRCDENTKCVSGRCREDACFDSDDGSIYKKGVTTKGDVNKVDSCNDSFSGTEYYCNGNQIASSSFICSDNLKCIKGACS